MIRMPLFRRKRTVLVHEYVTGGGLAGQELPGSWAVEGSAMRRAVAEDLAAVPGVRVVMTLDERLDDEPGTAEVVRVGPRQERLTLLRIARAADATLIIAPETEGLLYRRVGWIRSAKRRVLASKPSALVTAASKAGLADALLAAGVCTPPVVFGWPPYLSAIEGASHLNRRAVQRRTFLDPRWGTWSREPGGNELLPGLAARTDAERAVLRETDFATLKPRFPLVVKPIDGAGSIDTYLVADPAALSVALALRDPDAAAKEHALAWCDDELCQSHYWVSFGRLGAVLLQPHVAGTPMSASFLVDATGRPHLVGVGRQHIEIRDNQFHYRGGTVPDGTPAMAEEARKAIGAVPGLRGWVGVDFILDEQGQSVVLEINPRLTTSFVALRRLLPAGTLGEAMLDAFDHPRRLRRRDLARTVHGRDPLSFRADGSVAELG
jgi:predicted ATP-grasp superfamily ATP-dependent carboligase